MRLLQILPALLLAGATTTACKDVEITTEPARDSAGVVRSLESPCDPYYSASPKAAAFLCEDGGGGSPPPPAPPPDGIQLEGLNMTVCRNTASFTDTDGDGLSDNCEERLATAFAPMLVQST
jgi:hypothetical protein